MAIIIPCPNCLGPLTPTVVGRYSKLSCKTVQMGDPSSRTLPCNFVSSPSVSHSNVKLQMCTSYICLTHILISSGKPHSSFPFTFCVIRPFSSISMVPFHWTYVHDLVTLHFSIFDFVAFFAWFSPEYLVDEFASFCIFFRSPPLRWHFSLCASSPSESILDCSHRSQIVTLAKSEFTFEVFSIRRLGCTHYKNFRWLRVV